MQRKVYFENLDGLRFVLAVIVVLGHSMLRPTMYHISKNTYFDQLLLGTGNGSQAVAFFFTLSGFLINYLLLEEKAYYNTIHIGKFYLRRIFRIWPVYFFVLFFGFILYPFVKELMGFHSYIPNIWYLHVMFLSNFDSILMYEQGLKGYSPSFLGISWSVSIEEQFYLFWPLLFFLSKKVLPYIFIILICISYAFITYHDGRGTGNVNYYHTISRLMDLSLGGLVAYYAFFSNSFVQFFKNMPKIWIVIFYIIGLFYYIFHEILPQFSIPFMRRTLLDCFYLFIICEQCFASNSFYKFSNWKFISSQGKYTYALYMLHPIGVQLAIVIFKVLGMDRSLNLQNGLLYVIISITVGYILAILSYKYLETYFLNLKRKFQ